MASSGDFATSTPEAEKSAGAGYDYVASAREGASGQRLECASAHNESITHGDGLESAQIIAEMEKKVAVLSDGSLAVYGGYNVYHTLTSAFMCGCGSYPSRVKSLYLKSKIFFTSGFMTIFGSGRGSRVSCRRAWSRWLR